MSENKETPAAKTEPSLAEELASMPYEPLLPIEYKLIIGSLVTGVVLLLLLIWITYTWFSPTGP